MAEKEKKEYRQKARKKESNDRRSKNRRIWRQEKGKNDKEVRNKKMECIQGKRKRNVRRQREKEG